MMQTAQPATRVTSSSLETDVRTVDRSRLLDVQRLAGRDPGRVVEDDDAAHALAACERMGARARRVLRRR